jgi:hypothetical protein
MPAALAWAAGMAATQVYQFYFAFYLLCFGLTLPLTVLLGDLLKLPRLIKYLAAGAVAFGFWGRYVLERDAGYEIATLPLTMLAICCWVLLETEQGKPTWRLRLLLVLALSAIICFYQTLMAVIALAFMVYYAWGLMQRRVRPTDVAYHGLTIAGVLLLLTLTGQIDFLFRNALYLFGRVDELAGAPTDVISLLRNQPMAALWGLASSVIVKLPWSKFQWLLTQAAGAMGLFLTLIVAGLPLFLTRQPQRQAARIVFSTVLAGVLLSVVFLATHNQVSAGKALTYVFPYLMLAPLLMIENFSRLFQPALQRLSVLVVAIWLATQCAVALVWPNRPTDTFMAIPSRPEQYDLSPITSALAQQAPKRLLVGIPTGASWEYAFYTQLALSAYPVHFQTGLLLDNNTTYQNYMQPRLLLAPDYAVLLKEFDYIGPEQLGERIAETQDLVLYRVTEPDVAVFNAHEKLFWQQVADKPLFFNLSHDDQP